MILNQKGQYTPQRTCVGCREVKPKRELIRIVGTKTGAEVDTMGRKSGRGAYLCKAISCWEMGFEKGRLEHALRTKINSENRRELRNMLIQLASQREEANEQQK